MHYAEYTPGFFFSSFSGPILFYFQQVFSTTQPPLSKSPFSAGSIYLWALYFVHNKVREGEEEHVHVT